jgi:hypothetical protein
MLNQKRELFKNKILNNSFDLTGDLYPLVDNGYGQYIENRSGVAIEKTYTNPVRIYRIKKAVKKLNDTETPYIFEEVYNMQSDHETAVDVRLEFFYNGLKFKIKSRESLVKFGGVIGYQYELDEITEQAAN